MHGSKIVIAGGGMVAGYAAKQLVELGLKPGDLTIVSADSAPPYERPPLSKGFLAGRDTEESVRINPESFYRDHGIGLSLGSAISAVDAPKKRIVLSSGDELSFESLVLATGANPRELSVPGAKLANVLYLRSLDDSRAIRQCAESARHAVVIGGGFISMEVAAVLAQKNIDVTMLVREDRVFGKLFTPRMSQFFESYFTARGVRFLKNATLAELRGDGAVTSALLADGQSIPCQIVVAGIGVRPATAMLASSGLEVGDGVIVNEYLEASRPGIYAAGDVANYPDLLFGKRRRVEHWDNAVSQGQHCARVLMGERKPFRHVPYFFSDVFDLSYEFWGDPANADEFVHRGDLSGSSFSVWWLRGTRLVAAFIMNRPDDERDAAPKWIESKQAVSGARLAELSQPVSAALVPKSRI